MSVITWTLAVDWNGNDAFDGGVEDILAYVLNTQPLMVTSYGRNYPSQLIGKSNASQLTCRLDNSDERFSSFNTLSPLYPNVDRGRRVRLQATFLGVTYTIWYGRLEDIIPVTEAGVETATLTAFGVLATINKEATLVAIQTAILTGAAATEVLDKITWPAGDRAIDAGQTTMTYWWSGAERRNALDILRDIENTDGGFTRETRDGKFAFEDRYHRLTAPHTTSQATWTDAPGGALRYADIQQQAPRRELYNILQASVTQYTVQGLAALWTQHETDAPATRPLLQPGESREWWAEYPNNESPTNAVAVTAWPTPVAPTDFTANAASDGSGANLTANISVAVSKFDKAMKITLTNNGAVAAYITLLQARGTALWSQGATSVKAEDAASKTAYGDREYVLPASGIPTTSEAQDRLNAELSIRKDPLRVLSVLMEGNSDAQIVEMLTRDVSDRVTIVATGSAGLEINEDFFVESIEYRIQTGIFQAVCQCSPASGYSGFIVLDVGPPLGTGRLGY